MQLSPPTLTLLEASKSMSKSADPVPTRTEEILQEEEECVEAVEITMAVLGAVREEVVEVAIE